MCKAAIISAVLIRKCLSPITLDASRRRGAAMEMLEPLTQALSLLLPGKLPKTLTEEILASCSVPESDAGDIFDADDYNCHFDVLKHFKAEMTKVDANKLTSRHVRALNTICQITNKAKELQLNKEGQGLEELFNRMDSDLIQSLEEVKVFAQSRTAKPQSIRMCIIDTRITCCIELLLGGRLKPFADIDDDQREKIANKLKNSLDILLTLAEETKMALSAAIKKDLVRFIPSGRTRRISRNQDELISLQIAIDRSLCRCYPFLSQGLRWTNPNAKLPWLNSEMKRNAETSTFAVMPRYLPKTEDNRTKLRVFSTPDVDVHVHLNLRDLVWEIRSEKMKKIETLEHDVPADVLRVVKINKSDLVGILQKQRTKQRPNELQVIEECIISTENPILKEHKETKQKSLEECHGAIYSTSELDLPDAEDTVDYGSSRKFSLPLTLKPICQECQTPITDTTIRIHDGKHLCKKDFKANRMSCPICGSPATDKLYKTSEGKVCFHCYLKYLDRSPHEDDEVGQLQDHEESPPTALSLPPTQCFRCEGDLSGAQDVVRALGKRYHKSCFTCIVCRKNLSGYDDTFKSDEYKRIYCPDHYTKETSIV